MIVLASVYHTGTNFVFQHLLKGLPQRGMGYKCYNGGQPSGPGLVRIHCNLEQSEFLEWWLSRYPCIVPLRHPLTVAASWKARDRDLSLLPIQWEILKKKVDTYSPFYLPLDAPDRQEWLDDIICFLQMDLQTDWPVVMSSNNSATLTNRERAAVVEVMADGFFDRFGYEE